MQTKYTKKFKIEAVKKVLSRKKGTPKTLIAHLLGVNNSTLHGWVKSMENKDLREVRESSSSRGGAFEKSPHSWSSQEKFDIIIEASKIPEEELSKYCREKGLFSHHLEAWKLEFINSFGGRPSKDTREKKELKNEIKSLSSELRRKEKALAEAAALLILKKKANDLWGIAEDL